MRPLLDTGSKYPFGSPVWAPSRSRLGGLLGRLGAIMGPLKLSGCAGRPKIGEKAKILQQP
eukprot:2631386-Pyramimonas_sp.AAC.1